MPFMKHGVLGGPIQKAKVVKPRVARVKAPTPKEEAPTVVVIEEAVEAIPEPVVLVEEVDPILEEDKGYEPSEDFVEEKPKWVSKKQKKLLKLTGESK